MIPLDKLSESLASLNVGTSPRRAKPVEFARFKDKAGKTVVRAKLQGIQNAALGSFDDADAQMLAVLWDNRAQIIQRLEDDCRDLAISPISENPCREIALRFAKTPAEAEALRAIGLGVGDPIPLSRLSGNPTREFGEVLRSLAKSPKRLFPDADLGEPQKAFADTFSAETVIKEAFFPDLAKSPDRPEGQTVLRARLHFAIAKSL